MICTPGFVGLEFVYSSIVRGRSASGLKNPCRIPDPVRQHAFAPNRTALERWGKDSYPFATNSLCFRAASYHDLDNSGAVAGPVREMLVMTRYAQ